MTLKIFEKGYLLAIDPGYRYVGAALFHDGRLIFVAKERGPEGARHPKGLAAHVKNKYTRLSGKTPKVACERMQKYGNRKETHEDIDLVNKTVRALRKEFGKFVWHYTPFQWKRHIPKHIHKKRIEACLDRQELELCVNISHDEWDAIGIGLVATGRMRNR